MREYIVKIKQQFRDTYGFKPNNGDAYEPNFDTVSDGEYPMVINGMIDVVRIKEGKIFCCNFEYSINYEKNKQLAETLTSGGRIDGFPFDEKFPKKYLGQKYEIILVDGRVLEARVDDAREFMSEGLEWKTKEGNKERHVVAGWKLIQ